MEPASRALDPDTRPIRPLAFPNGVLKKHHLPRPLPLPPPLTPPQAADLLYRECLKNHAASRGGHALDGCGEFMPSPAADPTDPASLTCAACGCHRNFHRRLPDPRRSGGHADDHEAEDEMDGSDDDEDEYDEDHRRKRQQSSGSPPPPPPYSSAPHMLLALSAGLSGGGAILPAAVVPSAAPLPRKRFRTKFSPEQKEKMQELSERLGWRMQKRDEGLVEELCHKIGVGKGVFKVWMHNNKHHFVSGSSRRGGEIGSSEVTADGAVPDVSAACGGGIEGTGSFHPVNGSC